MIVDEFPDRTIIVDGVEYLYFGGTNYLGVSTNPEFQKIAFESIKKWGTAYGSSRNSNIKLSIYDKAEELLAKNMRTEAAVSVSSGMLAGKLVVQHLLHQTDAMFHLTDSHPAIMNTNSHPIALNGKFNPKLFDKELTKITIVTDAIPPQHVKPIDLDFLLEIPIEKEINLVIDESHSIGIISNEWQKLSIRENTTIIKIASMGKAFGLSGGAITGTTNFISEIRKQDCFIGASSMNPAFLETYCNAQAVYQSQKNKLVKNLKFIDTHFKNRSSFHFDGNYPNIYFDDPAISKKLIDNKIITTSFKYTNASKKLNRIVINANHNIEDLEKLLLQLNSE